jgi:hypothetical protein
MNGNDQLRQRTAWALAQIITVVPTNIDAYDKTETVRVLAQLVLFNFSIQNAYVITQQYASYYDIFVRHAFGNFRDILSEVSELSSTATYKNDPTRSILTVIKLTTT